MRFAVGNLSDLSLHPDSRWDSEYMCFAPYKNPSLTYIPIRDALLDAQYGLSIKMNEEGNGTKIYRMNEISNMMCDRVVSKFATIRCEEIEKFKLRDRDVLFNRTNSQAFVGRTGIFRKFSNENYVFASYLVRLIPNPDIITPEYLTVFLNTKYGVRDVKRRARISINQSNVNAKEVGLVEIPLVSLELQNKIIRAFDDSVSLIQASERIYQRAETILLSELGLIDWRPIHRLTFSRSFFDTKQVNRVDAEYFQPKYDDLVDAVKGCSSGWGTLESVVNLKTGNYQPESDQDYRYIELANIRGNGDIADCTREVGQNLPTRARRKVSAGDVIVSSVEGSLERIALIDDEYDKALCSTGFHVINSSVLNSETLLVFMKSMLGQLQLKKGCRGTILAAINKDEFAKIVIPEVTKEIQLDIQQVVFESFRLSKQSKHLLECVKQAVEIAIEDDELTAMEWLDMAAR